MKFIGIVPARGGSKGIKDKNLKSIGGKSLLERAINSAIEYMDVVVSTDSELIKSNALKLGAKVPFLRPSFLANDEANTIDVLIHAIKEYESLMYSKYDYVFLIEPTSPFRNSAHIKEVINKLKTNQFKTIISVCNLERKPENIFIKGKYLKKYIQKPNHKFEQRQLMRSLCRLNSAIYATKSEDLLSQRKILVDPIGFINMSDIESINIDSHLDLDYANFISKKFNL